MVAKVQPKTLVSLTVNALVDYIFHSWKGLVDWTKPDTQHNIGNDMNDILLMEHIPHFILDKIFSLLFRSYVDYYCIRTSFHKNTNCQPPPFFCNLVKHIFVPSLTILDLNHIQKSKMKNILYQNYEIISCVAHGLVDQIQLLNNLVEINLQSDEILELCGYEVLKQIGQHCPKLRSLDVSQNIEVSDPGLKRLIPSKTNPGCPMLNKLNISHCSVTPKAETFLIKGLPSLKHLACDYLKSSLLELPTSEQIKTKLNHVFVYGELQSHHIYTLINTCPEVKVLRVNLSDFSVYILKNLKDLCELELFYVLEGMPSSPERATELYFRHSGQQLISLSIECEFFTSEFLKIICTTCTNLKKLSIDCESFKMNEDLTTDVCLVNLKSFSFTVGQTTSWQKKCSIPFSTFHYILHPSDCLEQLVIRMNNDKLNNRFIHSLLNSVNVSKLKMLYIYTSEMNFISSRIKLNMDIVQLIINVCPQLVKLGNIIEWDLSIEEIKHVIIWLKSENSALDVILQFPISIDCHAIV